MEDAGWVGRWKARDISPRYERSKTVILSVLAKDLAPDVRGYLREYAQDDLTEGLALNQIGQRCSDRRPRLHRVQVTDDPTRVHVDHIFRDVRAMIRNAFKILPDHDVG